MDVPLCDANCENVFEYSTRYLDLIEDDDHPTAGGVQLEKVTKKEGMR